MGLMLSCLKLKVASTDDNPSKGGDNQTQTEKGTDVFIYHTPCSCYLANPLSLQSQPLKLTVDIKTTQLVNDLSVNGSFW